MNPKIPEILKRPPRKKNDTIRIATTTSILGAELGFRVANGSNYTPTEQALIYGGAIGAILVAAMPFNRFMENYYGNFDNEGRELDS